MPWGSRGGGGGTLPGPTRGGTLAGGGTLPRGVPCLGGYPGQGVPWPGGTLVGGTLAGGYPGQVLPLARSGWGGTLAGGVPWPGGTLARGGTQLGQHREYLLHGGRYASCVHAGGLFCYLLFSDLITVYTVN